MTFKTKIPQLVVHPKIDNLPSSKKFTLSKRRIYFSEHQLNSYDFYLDPYCNRLLNDRTEYTLLVSYNRNDKLQYQIVIGSTDTFDLKLNWFNLIKLKIVHDLIKIPKWLKTILDKFLDKILGAVVLIISSYFSFKLGQGNTHQLNTTIDTMRKEIKVLRDSVELLKIPSHSK